MQCFTIAVFLASYKDAAAVRYSHLNSTFPFLVSLVVVGYLDSINSLCGYNLCPKARKRLSNVALRGDAGQLFAVNLSLLLYSLSKLHKASFSGIQILLMGDHWRIFVFSWYFCFAKFSQHFWTG